MVIPLFNSCSPVLSENIHTRLELSQRKQTRARTTSQIYLIPETTDHACTLLPLVLQSLFISLLLLPPSKSSIPQSSSKNYTSNYLQHFTIDRPSSISALSLASPAFVCLSVCLSVLSVCLSVCLFVCLFALFVCSFVYTYIYTTANQVAVASFLP
ncbi:hypothetical protein B0T17DRAFT_290210 [Bombardia bombarda]|uniref:Uncharacterized protein n=1 Tax=Bombardia bombarda TaxID=252184 RepID=A0AA39WTQ7_9PEZI|nr:hypothetical protein B0T17DRAFT_290210 [Bombardia bombarda]